MITTKDIASETGLSQRAIQKRIDQLKISPQRVGRVLVLTPTQAEKVRSGSAKVGRPKKNRTSATP